MSLSLLAVYNPSLGTSDATFHQQIVFYFSAAAEQHGLREDEHERLRQVGLAQGMVAFAKSFSSGAAVDAVETLQSRVVLHELEDGWWILAAVRLTLPSRQVSPPALLVQQLVRAHSIFRLHHGSPLDAMFAKHRRAAFCSILHKYWARFASSWHVLLHGSPAVDMYAGVKLAAGGELGVGVGEEAWGSSERDVLEHFARRTDGLVDVMVSRFGEPPPRQQAQSSADPGHVDLSQAEPWLGGGRHVDASDGVVFSGLGAVSRDSLRHVSHWVETIYSLGDQAYGIRDNPTSHRKRRKRRSLKPPTSPLPEARQPLPKDTSQVTASTLRSGLPPGIPPPIVKAVETSLQKASAAAEQGDKASSQDQKPLLASLGDTETWMKYMTLGYGTAWGAHKPVQQTQPTSSQRTAPKRTPSPEAMRHIEPEPHVDVLEEKLKQQIRQENDGYFLIGLKGDMYHLEGDDETEDDWNHRIPLRTLHVEVSQRDDASLSPSGDSDETPAYEREIGLGSTSPTGLSRLRPVIYVHRPFIYTFLFKHRTNSLSIASFYRDIHNFFSPLRRSLDKSTSPDKVAARLLAASQPYTTTSSQRGSDPNMQPIYDLVYDPRTLTVHSSLPNIPDPGTLIAEGLGSNHPSGWSRVEALNVHSQILATISSTRRNLSEIERTCKTSRGWWVVWMRLPPSQPSSEEAAQVADEENTSVQFNTDDLREAFLIRRAGDSIQTPGNGGRSSGKSFASGMWSSMGIGGGTSQSQRMGEKAAGWAPKGVLGEGIGIDARRYVEELLSLNR
ncbi:hypothetical protein BDU57DRAFT_545401 [Ampelomyces quisqualis]|uniref:CCZ1/INTU/HSP4 first Longin domain-containing protein n=1 Tax=Ampelomyces quisqualis TaxID=50730 RepID=A0A6A5R5N2_AMPQU|nr:hypothetical protein BDU57DRAFT_545401 [Ampelomyces quisqualis]